MKSNYALYLFERENARVIEDERGFAAYKILPQGMYIQDIFVRKEFRKDGVATEYANKIAEIAKKLGIGKLIGSVDKTANNAAVSEQVLVAYGMRPVKEESNGLMYFVKELS